MMMAEAPAMMMEDKPANNDKNADEKTGMLGGLGGMGKLGGGLLGGGDDNGSDRTVERKPVYSQCCCCMCACSNENTDGTTCCGCFPVKCGVVAIGITVWTITLYMFLTTYFLILNEYVRWWFPFVTMILLVPMLIATCFFIGFFTKDCKRTRGNLTAAVIMSIISMALVITWSVCYYLWLYKQEFVYTGTGEDLNSYIKTSKKGYIFWLLAEASFVITLFSYFLCVIRKYVNCYPEEKKEEEPKK